MEKFAFTIAFTLFATLMLGIGLFIGRLWGKHEGSKREKKRQILDSCSVPRSPKYEVLSHEFSVTKQIHVFHILFIYANEMRSSSEFIGSYGRWYNTYDWKQVSDYENNLLDNLSFRIRYSELARVNSTKQK